MCIVENQSPEKSEEATFIVRNHVEQEDLKVCLPISKKRAGDVEKAKKVFLCIAGYFEKRISETLYLYQKTGIDENGKDKYEKIARCLVIEGHREVIDFTPEAIFS